MSLFNRRSAVLLCVTLVSLSLVGSAAARQKKDDKKQQEKMDQAQRQEIQNLVKLADAAMTGQPTPNDITLNWANHFLKALDGKSYVPFTVSFGRAQVTGSTLAMYVRVARRGAAPAQASGAASSKKDDKKTAVPEYPFEDVHFVELRAPAPGEPYRISRPFAVPAGDYDVYVAVSERPAPGSEKSKTPAPPKAGVLKQPLTVPDFWANELTTSSIILADRVEPLSAPLTKEQQTEQPYTLGNTQIVPAVDSKFTKKEELSVIFLVYNPALDASKKPDVTVEYNFHHKTPEGDKYFNKTEPQNFNASTLPAQFDVTAGHQIVAGQSVPLAMFPEGEYRLEIKVTDKISGKSLTRDVGFTVLGS